MEPKDHIGFEVKRLDNEIRSRVSFVRASMGAGELTRMQSWIIRFLYSNQDREIFQKDVEAEFSIARSTATGILQLMEKKGFIKRQSVERDARLKKLTLTDKGIELQKNTIAGIDALEEKMREGISQEELDIFFRVIRKVRSNVEREHNETDRRRDRC